MRKPRNLLALGLAVLLAACLGAAYWTREAGAGRGTAKKPAAANQPSLIDDRLLQTARQMAALADTDEEQDLAREALRQADHELDQAYATALREAAEPAPKNGPPASVPVQQATARIAQLKTRVAAGQARIAQLSKQAADEQAADQLELVKAQLELDQNDLEDAQEDLIRLGGDRHSRLERALQEHESAQHDAAAPSKARGVPATATLWDQARVWFSLGSRNYDLHAAEQQAAARASELDRAHDALESKAARPAAAAPDADASSEEDEDTAATVARLRRLSDQRKTLAELDRRIQDGRQLAAVYQRWSSLVETRSRGVLHLLLRSLAVVFAILLAALLLDGAIRRAFRQSDRRRLHQLRIISGLATQLVAVVFVLLIVFGPPTQLSTILGLLTAGLTVVLKDFIVAFFGWFALMGKNGIRVGDWVEIEGVGGEVIEIGLLKTVLLEMGNWTTTGHPTGRRVSFMNGFAMAGHYFNFSTAGQWLWDELQVTLPAAGDPYRMSQQIHQVVERETADEARQAEQDWERVTHQYGIRPFAAKPAVNLRPGPNGLDVVVRYITRAPRRYEVKSRLFQAIVELLHKPEETAANPAAPAS